MIQLIASCTNCTQKGALFLGIIALLIGALIAQNKKHKPEPKSDKDD